MNFFTHIAISKIIYEHLKNKMKLDKRYFIYGNLKPDLSLKINQVSHTFDNYFSYVCSCGNNLMKGGASVKDFSIKLGEICHYTCDFFCMYHLNTEIFNKSINHFLYELKLHFKFLELTRKEKFEIKIEDNNLTKNIKSIIFNMRLKYLSEIASMEKDISYAVNTATWVCESVGLFLTNSMTFVPCNEMDSYTNLTVV